MLLILHLRGQRQSELWVQSHSVLQSNFQENKGHTNKPSLKTNKQKIPKNSYELQRWKGTSLSITEMKNKSTLLFPLTAVRMSMFAKVADNKCWHRYVEREPSFSLRLQTDAVTLKNSVENSKSSYSIQSIHTTY